MNPVWRNARRGFLHFMKPNGTEEGFFVKQNVQAKRQNRSDNPGDYKNQTGLFDNTGFSDSEYTLSVNRKICLSI